MRVWWNNTRHLTPKFKNSKPVLVKSLAVSKTLEFSRSKKFRGKKKKSEVNADLDGSVWLRRKNMKQMKVNFQS